LGRFSLDIGHYANLTKDTLIEEMTIKPENNPEKPEAN